MLYLVNGKITISYYMCDKTEIRYTTRLVDADDKHEAEEKFKQFFNDKTDEYAVYYWATVDDVSAVIS